MKRAGNDLLERLEGWDTGGYDNNMALQPEDERQSYDNMLQ